ncbi:MAG: EF-hand domain-containing protein [Nitrospira sp.]|nr:EF-hand domain-containing protein [Nitrospira sp.]
MRKVLVRRYRPAADLAVLVVVLVSALAAEESVAWAERKASVGRGGVASNRAAVSQQTSRSSAPIEKDVGISQKQRIRKGPALEKGKGPTKEQSVRRAPRRARATKPLRPQATLTPKPDVSYHGMLQQPQRYTPHYEHGKGGVPNPNAGALLHEHFQELDKNRDGSIDPFERALGRLDLERDLADHQWP